MIRVNPDPDQNLVGRVLMRDRWVIVASPGLVRGKGKAAVPAVVRGASDQPATWEMKTARGRSPITIDPVLSMSSLIMVRDAVRAGAGIARLPASLVSRDLASGALVHWGDVEGPEIVLWTLYPTRRLLSTRVSAFLDHLKESFPTGSPEELAAFIGQ